MQDRIIRPMGAASLLIEPDPRPGRMFVSISDAITERCRYMASTPHDVAATLGFEAADQHFDCPAKAVEWLDLRSAALTDMIYPPQLAA